MSVLPTGAPAPVIVYGTVVLDRMRSLDAWPPKGGYGEYTSETTALGGEAANTAAALTAWGRQVALLGNSLGNTEDSAVLRRLLAEHGVSDEWCDCAAGPAPTCEIYVTPDGERTFFGRSWDVAPLELPDWPAAWFTADPNHGDASRRALAQAAEAGHSCYAMDFVRPEEQLPPGCIWQCSTDWFGERGAPEQNAALLASWCRKHRCHGVLTDGSGPLLVADASGDVRAYPTYQVPPPVDTTGAGDAFRAGMLIGLSAGRPLIECLAFASAAGALTTQSLGATRALPTLREVEELMQAQAGITSQFTC